MVRYAEPSSFRYPGCEDRLHPTKDWDVRACGGSPLGLARAGQGCLVSRTNRRRLQRPCQLSHTRGSLLCVCVCVQLSIVNCPTCWYASLACLSRLPSDPFIGSRDCRYSMSMGAVSHNTSVAIALGDVRYMASIVREVKASCVHRRKHSDDYFEVSNIGRPLLHADGIERL
jgi:hypothetical protein